MTLDYAIRLARKWAFGGVCSLREGEAQEYHKMALAALEAQRDGAAPVVRCRECVFKQRTGRCVKTGAYVNDDYFCSCGRKDGGNG